MCMSVCTCMCWCVCVRGAVLFGSYGKGENEVSAAGRKEETEGRRDEDGQQAVNLKSKNHKQPLNQHQSGLVSKKNKASSVLYCILQGVCGETVAEKHSIFAHS